MSSKTIWTHALVTAATLLAAGGAAAHGDVTGQCIADAAKTRDACITVCRDDFRASVDTCRNVNHDCAETARSNRESCVSGVLQALKQCVDDTCGVFQTVIAQCRSDFAAGTPERDACIDGAQTQNFQCRDQCRESVQLFASLKACRDEFRAEIKQCPAATPPQ